MKWYIYIVQCADGVFYTGITNNVGRRIREHNEDDTLGSRFVRVRRPVTLVYYEQKTNRSEALKREIEIKGWSRKKKLQLINGSVSMKSKLTLRNVVTKGA